MKIKFNRFFVINTCVNKKRTVIKSYFCNLFVFFKNRNLDVSLVGHFAPESSKDMRHVLVWSDLYFYPSRQSCTAIFI
eukprot:SAG11_NODE_6315_length_1339_cov_2.419355_2_plen_77_part_01